MPGLMHGMSAPRMSKSKCEFAQPNATSEVGQPYR